MGIQFIDLAAQQARIKDRLDARIQAVLAGGNYIMGPEVRELEDRLAEFCGAAHVLTCANGTDALHLALLALKAGPGEAECVLCSVKMVNKTANRIRHTRSQRHLAALAASKQDDNK